MVLQSPQFDAVHVDLVSVQVTVSGHGTSVKKQVAVPSNPRLLTVREHTSQRHLVVFSFQFILDINMAKTTNTICTQVQQFLRSTSSTTNSNSFYNLTEQYLYVILNALFGSPIVPTCQI